LLCCAVTLASALSLPFKCPAYISMLSSSSFSFFFFFFLFFFSSPFLATFYFTGVPGWWGSIQLWVGSCGEYVNMATQRFVIAPGKRGMRQLVHDM